MDNSKLAGALRAVSTDSIAAVLRKKGLTNIWLRGPMPLAPGQPRIAGPAFTLRFIPARADVAGRVTRDAVELMPEGAVIVADARGVLDAGAFGDIVVTRMAKRGVSGIVTDGAVRDSQGLIASGVPVWCAGIAAPQPVAAHVLAAWQEPISCGGVAIYPGDWIVADSDGACVVPAALAEETARLAAVLEREDEALLARVRAGATMDELYPPKK